MALVGTVASEQAGLGAIPQPRSDRACGKDRCHLVLKDM